MLKLQDEHDRTSPKKIEALRDPVSEAFDYTPIACCTFSEHGIVKSINQEGCRLLESERHRILEFPLLHHVARADRRAFLEHMRRCRAGEDPVFTALSLQTPTGNTIPIRIFSRRGHDGHALCYHTALVDLSERKQEAEDRRRLLRELMVAEEKERARFSRELHDRISQHVTALSLGLKRLRDKSDGAPIAEISQLEKIVAEVGRSAHDLAVELRPAALDDLGLHAALANYTSQWSQHHGLPLDFQVLGLDSQRLAPEVETTVYRVIQEALTNVAKHSQAKRVSVTLHLSRDDLLAVVEDDGRGFDVQSATRQGNAQLRLGVLGMAERASLVGGRLEIESRLARGTGVFLRIARNPDHRAG